MDFEKEKDSEEQRAELERIHPLANPAVWEDFEKCRDVNGLYKWAASHGLDVRRYSKLLFARLCYTEQPLSVLLQALEDALLGTAPNFNFLLDWQLRKRKGEGRLQRRLKADDINLLQEWLKRQFDLGLRSEDDIVVFLRFISRVSDATSDESLRLSLITSFEGLQSSSVLRFKDLENETQFSILACITQGPVTRRLLELGIKFVEDMRHLGLEGTEENIAAFIGGVIHAHTSSREDEEQETPSSEIMPTILETIWRLPLEISCSVTLIITKALIEDSVHRPPGMAAPTQASDTWLIALAKERRFRRKMVLKTKIEGFLGKQKPEVAVPYLQQLDGRQRARFIVRYWMVDIFQVTRECVTEFSRRPIREILKMLQRLHLSETIVQIIKQAGEFDAIINKRDVKYMIKKHLPEQPQLAEQMFHFYPALRVEDCPELAERMISDPERHPDTALRHVRRRRTRSVHYAFRAELLGRMALAYSTALHLTPRMAFNRVYQCYIQQMKEHLGPVSVAMAHAFTRAGLIRPLQAGQWVSTMQVRWVVSIVRCTEGNDVANRLDEIVYKWRSTLVE